MMKRLKHVAVTAVPHDLPVGLGLERRHILLAPVHQLLWQRRDMALLEPPQHQGRRGFVCGIRQRAVQLRERRVTVRASRFVPLAEILQCPEHPRFCSIEHRPDIRRAIFHRGAGHQQGEIDVHGERRIGQAGAGVLDLLGFVEDSCAPADPAEAVLIVAKCFIGGKHPVGGLQGLEVQQRLSASELAAAGRPRFPF